MLQVALIFLCLALGILLRLSGRLPDATPKVLAGWVINVALPAAALADVYQVTIDGEWALSAVTPWIGALLALAFLLPVSRWLNWSKERLGAMVLVAGWGNTSFVGLPMIAAYFGAEWLALGLFIDLLGSYLSLSILGIAIATICSSDTVDWRAILRRIVTFPPFLAIVIALATNHLERPAWLHDLFVALAATLTPLALAAVGYAIRIEGLKDRLAPLGIGLTFRLVLAPLAIFLMYGALGTLRGDMVSHVTIFEMAMPPMLGASIIAMERELEPDLVALMIGIGIPLSMATAPVWWWVLQAI